MEIALDLSPLETLPGVTVRLNDPASVSGDPELPGFVLDLSLIFLRSVP
ncbi:MAG: hypothetical protein H7Y38_16125 [Armatimonadetes bacterium]|nr:hypothetical protein [Armatimonadota bacterium]